MNKTNTEKLFKSFPIIYRSYKSSLMGFGFACGDGWFDLVYSISAMLEADARKGIDNHEPIDEQPVVVQVKEKFGGLRFYAHGITPDQNKIIHERCLKSTEICEVCGKPGKIENFRGYYLTICHQCLCSKPSGALSLHLDGVMAILERCNLVNAKVVGAIAYKSDNSESGIELVVDRNDKTTDFDISRASNEIKALTGHVAELTLRDKIRDDDIDEVLLFSLNLDEFNV